MVVCEYVDAAVVRPQTVDLLVPNGDPEVFAEEFEDVECGWQWGTITR